jgi:hypothetical protein
MKGYFYPLYLVFTLRNFAYSAVSGYCIFAFRGDHSRAAGGMHEEI